MWAWREWKSTTYVSQEITVQYSLKLIIVIIIIMFSSLLLCLILNKILNIILLKMTCGRVDFKIIRLARVRFEFETPCLERNRYIDHFGKHRFRWNKRLNMACVHNISHYFNHLTCYEYSKTESFHHFNVFLGVHSLDSYLNDFLSGIFP
jgi:hypothetical protein